MLPVPAAFRAYQKVLGAPPGDVGIGGDEGDGKPWPPELLKSGLNRRAMNRPATSSPPHEWDSTERLPGLHEKDTERRAQLLGFPPGCLSLRERNKPPGFGHRPNAPCVAARPGMLPSGSELHVARRIYPRASWRRLLEICPRSTDPLRWVSLTSAVVNRKNKDSNQLKPHGHGCYSQPVTPSTGRFLGP